MNIKAARLNQSDETMTMIEIAFGSQVRAFKGLVKT
jgi:hypothetical protein